jgi:polyisoprenoid-binding protein YceI
MHKLLHGLVVTGLGLGMIVGALGLQQAPSKPAPTGTPASIQAGPVHFDVDPVHSTNVFRIKHVNTTWFYGRFNDISGSFEMDPTGKDLLSVEASIKVDSIDTNNATRDSHLKAPELFDAAKHPTITFKSTSLKKKGTDEYEVKGELTLHGVTKTLTVMLDYTGSTEHPKMGHRAGVETTFTIKRSDFGMGAMTDMLSDEVRLTVSLEGVDAKRVH